LALLPSTMGWFCRKCRGQRSALENNTESLGAQQRQQQSDPTNTMAHPDDSIDPDDVQALKSWKDRRADSVASRSSQASTGNNSQSKPKKGGPQASQGEPSAAKSTGASTANQMAFAGKGGDKKYADEDSSFPSDQAFYQTEVGPDPATGGWKQQQQKLQEMNPYQAMEEEDDDDHDNNSAQQAWKKLDDPGVFSISSFSENEVGGVWQNPHIPIGIKSKPGHLRSIPLYKFQSDDRQNSLSEMENKANNSYVSSSSSYSTEDRLFRPAAHAALSNYYMEETERFTGPVDLDDSSTVDGSALHRPDTDDGGDPPVVTRSVREKIKLVINNTIQMASPKASPRASPRASPAANESRELDAIIASVDQSAASLDTTQEHKLRIPIPLSRTPSPAFRPEIFGLVASSSTQDAAVFFAATAGGAGPDSSVISKEAAPDTSGADTEVQNANTSNSSEGMPTKQRGWLRKLNPSRRDSPSLAPQKTPGVFVVTPERQRRQERFQALQDSGSQDSGISPTTADSASPSIDALGTDSGSWQVVTPPPVARLPHPETPLTLNTAALTQSRSQDTDGTNADFYIEDDRLSDVPSDVDIDTKERYLMACRFLKTTLIQKNARTMRPEDKEFLAALLEEPREATSSPERPSVAPTVSMGSSSATPSSEHRTVRALVTENKEEELSMSAQLLQVRSRSGASTEAARTYSQTSSSLFSRESEEYPFKMLGTERYKPKVLTPTLMEALRGFFPYTVVEDNFWLKFALERDGASLSTLLYKVRTSKHTITAIETDDGYVFGAFCSSTWRIQHGWYGSGEAFLWRLKRPRLKTTEHAETYNNDHDNEIEIYPYTGTDDMVQFSTRQALAVGGGSDWNSDPSGSPYRGSAEPSGIGLLIDADLLGGETASCVTFANPRLGDRSVTKGEFEITAMEVWTVTPCSTVEDAEDMEMQREFVERNLLRHD
jgi:TLD